MTEGIERRPEIQETKVHTIDSDSNEIDIDVQIFPTGGRVMASSTNPFHVDIPVLVIWGDNDENFIVNSFSEEFRNRMPLPAKRGSLQFRTSGDDAGFTGERIYYDFLER